MQEHGLVSCWVAPVIRVSLEACDVEIIFLTEGIVTTENLPLMTDMSYLVRLAPFQWYMYAGGPPIGELSKPENQRLSAPVPQRPTQQGHRVGSS